MGRRVLVIAAIAASLALPGATATGAASPPTGDAHGLALLAVIHRAYVHVPAVMLSGNAPGLSFRFTLVLRSGVAVAEEFVGRTPSGTTMLVAPKGPVTYARDGGRTCWRRVAASDPQSFDNIGLRFPDHDAMRVKAPRRVSGGNYELPAVVGHDPGVFLVDGKTALVKSLTVTSGGVRIVQHVRSLPSAPKLPVPAPLC